MRQVRGEEAESLIKDRVAELYSCILCYYYYALRWGVR